MQEISTSDAHPSITRVSDAKETAFSFATRKKSSGISISSLISKGLMKVLERRGWNLDEICLSFIGYEGGKPHVARQKKIVKDIVGKHGGIGIGKGPGVLYDQKKYDTVSDTAAPWSKLLPLYRNVMAAADKSYAELGVRGWIMCHLSHSYHSGACLYFTFAFKHDGVDPLAQYEPLKNAIQQAFVDSGGTLSHHHAVGTEHAAWLEQDISAPGVHMIDGLLTAMDPGRNFNPGKIIAK
jgi:alkyldihydroxyacetonephosphate synthase